MNFGLHGQISFNSFLLSPQLSMKTLN